MLSRLNWHILLQVDGAVDWVVLSRLSALVWIDVLVDGMLLACEIAGALAAALPWQHLLPDLVLFTPVAVFQLARVGLVLVQIVDIFR